jgi:signal transduction histidine kinase
VSRLSGWPRSATARLAMLSLATILACVGIVLGVVYAAVDRQINSDAQALVEEDRSLTRALIDGEERQTVRRVIAQLLGEPGARGRTLLVTDDAGQVIAGNIAAWPAPLRVGTGWHAIDLHRQGVAHAEMVGLVAEALPDGGRLLVGHALYARERLRESIYTAGVAALIGGTVLAMLGAALVTRFVDTRVAEAAEATQRFASGELAMRLAGEEIDDPFGRLAGALNTMFDRVAALMTELRMVTDAMAHDLRSPLTRLRLRAERALGADDPARRESELVAVLGEADGMLRLIATLLAVTRAEAGVGRDDFIAVDGAALMESLADIYEPAAEDGGVELTLAAPSPVPLAAHPQLLAQALANLVDNALKHGGGAVELFAGVQGRVARLGVADRGPGIPPDQRDAMIKRFGRADAARTTPGAGLGLSLAAAIAHLHGGRLVLGDNAPGLRATVELPLAR